MSRMRHRIRSDKCAVSMDSCSNCMKTSSITSLVNRFHGTTALMSLMSRTKQYRCSTRRCSGSC
eukprot:8128881-Alexandrium_andersonii.AAC.1